MRAKDKAGESFPNAALALLDGLYSYARVLTRDPTEAEDLVQETYVRALNAPRRPGPGNNLKVWLFVILRQLWLNRLRHLRCGPEFVSLDADAGLGRQLGDTTSDPQVVHLRLTQGEAVRAAIERLPPAHREVVVLRDLEGFSYASGGVQG